MRKALFVISCVAAVAVLFGCDRKTTYVEEVVGPVTCAQCHDPSNLITGKQTEWAESVHGTGDAYVRGTSASCAGCHSGNAFAERIAAGLDVDEVTQGDPNPTRQDCRACHKIHETYTEADFALRTESAVALYAVPGATFNGGEGNLCVNCHQPRRIFPEAVNDSISGISSHWGPHHGPQSAMMLGVAGAGDVAGSPSGHYGAVRNTCRWCHMGAEDNHTFEPDEAVDAEGRFICVQCHPGADDFDIEGVQTEIESLGDMLGAELLNLGLINENSEDGHPTVSKAQQDEAVALWNWIYVLHEDKSMGVHNPDYARALLEEGLLRLGVSPAQIAARGAKREAK
jgi:hypothetical protein